MRSDKENFFNNKEEFRKYCLKKLKQSAKYRGIKNNYLVLQKLKKILKNLKFRTILFYMPLAMEVDFTKLFSYLRKNHTLLVPFMQGISFKVVKYRLPLLKRKFSIKEPNNSYVKFSKIDILVVPVLGVDKELKRIGFGKGMYDRFVKSLNKKALVIFVQLEQCYTNSQITQDHDMKADIYLAPKKTIKRGRYDNRIKHINSSCACKFRSRVLSSKKDKRCKL